MHERQGRVLMLLENCPYPADNRVRNEAWALRDAGYQVSVIAPKGPGETSHQMVDGVEVFRYRFFPSGGGFLGFAWEYTYAMVATFLLSLRVLFRPGFDVVHAHNPPDLFVMIGAFYKLLGKRFVFDQHDLSPEMYMARFSGGPSIPYHALRFFETLTFRLSDHVMSANGSYRQVALERGGVPETRVTVVRNGPNLNVIRPRRPPDDLLRYEGHLFGYIGEMGPQDGIDYLLRALQLLRDDLGESQFQCLLVGDGESLQSLKALTRSLGLESHVRFVGRLTQQELCSWITGVDICVDPDPSNSYNDKSTMVKIMEYMAPLEARRRLRFARKPSQRRGGGAVCRAERGVGSSPSDPTPHAEPRSPGGVGSDWSATDRGRTCMVLPGSPARRRLRNAAPLRRRLAVEARSSPDEGLQPGNDARLR